MTCSSLIDRVFVGFVATVAVASAGCSASATVSTDTARTEASAPTSGEEQPEPERVVVKEDRLELDDRIHFGFDSDVLATESEALLDEVADKLKEAEDVDSVRIVGHTDSMGASDYNRELSTRRADAVRRHLQERGVPQDLETEGFGSSRPLCTDETTECHERNRRVEFILDRS